MEIVIDSPEEVKLRAKLAEREDAEARRMERFLAMPDLARTPSNPCRGNAALECRV